MNKNRHIFLDYFVTGNSSLNFRGLMDYMIIFYVILVVKFYRNPKYFSDETEVIDYVKIE